MSVCVFEINLNDAMFDVYLPWVSCETPRDSAIKRLRHAPMRHFMQVPKVIWNLFQAFDCKLLSPERLRKAKTGDLKK